MELRDNNLYVNGEIIVFLEDGEEILTRELLVIEPKVEDKYHTVVDNDYLDKLADEYYSDFVSDASKYWWVIADANNIYDPTDISDLVGTDILIPDILRVRLLI